MSEPLLKPGLHPKASDALRRVPVSADRIIQTIGTAPDSGGFHLAEPGNDAPGRFWIINGRRYCAATDFSIRNPTRLTEPEIINLLERLARNGFAAWYRKPGFDGWPVRNRRGVRTTPHIHVVYAGIPMKAVLRDQVEQFLRGRNGLNNGAYNFHTFTEAAIDVVRELFEANDRGRLPRAEPQDVRALALAAGFDDSPTFLLGMDDPNAAEVEVEDLDADFEGDFDCGCGCEDAATDSADDGARLPNETEETPNLTDDYEAALEEGQHDGSVEGLGGEIIEALALRPWRVAKSLLKLREQVNHMAPNRSKASDGTIGDPAHQGRESDHNPWVVDGGTGVVTALDITHDPAHGCNVDVIAASIIAARDSRIKYIIRSRKILSSYPVNGRPAWTWRPYNGTNPHVKHVHISVKSDKPHYDSTAPWDV